MHWLLIFFKNYFLIFFILLFEHWFRKENSLFFYQKIVMNEYEMTTHKIRSISYMLTLTLLSIRVPWWTWTTTLVNPENKTISLIAFDVIKLDNEFHYTEVWGKNDLEENISVIQLRHICCGEQTISTSLYRCYESVTFG